MSLVKTGLVLALLMLVSGGPALAQTEDCGDGPITIAGMQWPAAAILAHIHADLIAEQLGCPTDVVAGDLAATTSSMATTGQPAIAPELWIGRVAEVWNSALGTGEVRAAGQSYEGGSFEGWFVPQFVIADHPKLAKAADLNDYWQVFAAEGADKAELISCPPDWACSVINKNLIRAFGLSDHFKVVEPSSRYEMDQLIGEAMSRKRPILFYYWQPNAVLAQFDFHELDLGAYDAEAMKCLAQRDCADPKPSAFATEPVVIGVASHVFSDAPRVAAYLQRASMPLSEMNALLAWQNAQAATPEDAAKHFVETRQAVWQGWLGD